MSDLLDKFCRLSVALTLTRKDYVYHMQAPIGDTTVDLKVERFINNNFERFIVVVKRSIDTPQETAEFRKEVKSLRTKFKLPVYLAIVRQDGKEMAVDGELQKRMQYEPKQLQVRALDWPGLDNTP